MPLLSRIPVEPTTALWPNRPPTVGVTPTACRIDRRWKSSWCAMRRRSELPLDDGTVTLAMIQALIPLVLRAGEDVLQLEVTELAGARYAHANGRPDLVRWGSQAGRSISPIRSCRSRCREYEAAAETVSAAFGLAKSSVSPRFTRTSATALQLLQERGHDDAEWFVLLLDGKLFASE